MGTTEEPAKTATVRPAPAPAPAPAEAVDPYATDLDAQREANEKAYAASIKGQEMPPSITDAG